MRDSMDNRVEIVGGGGLVELGEDIEKIINDRKIKLN